MSTRLLRQLRGATNVEEVTRQPELQRRTNAARHEHNVYRNTKVTSRAQEEQSAVPAGVRNVMEDSDDDEAWDGGDSKELEKETQALQVAKNWLSDKAERQSWDTAAEAMAPGAEEVEVDLRQPKDGIHEEGPLRLPVVEGIHPPRQGHA